MRTACLRHLSLSLVLVLTWGLLVAEVLGALAVRFTTVPALVRLGSAAAVEVATVAGAVCDLEVRNLRGVVRTAGIRPKRAPASARIVWTWRIYRTMAPGVWKVAVDCLLGEQIGRAEARFTVR